MAVVCDIYKTCVIFNNEVAGMKVTVQIMKSKYCNDNFSRCLCYKHSQDPSLYPYPVERQLPANGCGLPRPLK
jgi:hypothetical protein